MSHPTKAPTIAHLYQYAAETYNERVVFATRHKTKLWKPTTYAEFYETGLNLATALKKLGVKAKDHVGLLADNRLEWAIADCAVQLCGAADVPRGTDLTDADIQYILPHADVKVCFIENILVWNKIKNNKSKLKRVKTYILMDPEQQAPAGVKHMSDLIEEGKALRGKGDNKIAEGLDNIKPDDLCTLIYTSGTTGAPKGVMLKHSNVMFIMDRIPMDLGVNDRLLSILPVWHIFERVLEMYTISRGAATYYTNIRKLGEDLRNVQPTFMGSAPRLWENLYLKILDNVQASHPMRRFLFHTAYGLAEIYKNSLFFMRDRKLHLHKPNKLLFAVGWVMHFIRFVLISPLYGFFNISVLERIRQSVGACLKASISGGGALPPHVDKFFNYVGISVLEGYGMTETSAVISARTKENLVIGTVGPPIEGMQIRIIDLRNGDILYPNPDNPHGGLGLKGEIHINGPQVMKGYYKNKETTENVLKDGWLNTGDIGMITFNGCLKIMGRSKDTIVLASGENVEPVPVENKLVESAFIDQVMIVGQDEKFMTALVVPSLEGFQATGLDISSLDKLIKEPQVQETIAKVIKTEISAENGFKSFERLPDFRLISKPFEVGDELTNLFKLKRHVITEKYSHLIGQMYGRSSGSSTTGTKAKTAEKPKPKKSAKKGGRR